MRGIINIAFVIALMSELAGMANASPPPFFLAQRAMPPALTDAPFGMPFGQHPRAGRAEPSFQRFASGADGTYPQAGLIDVNGVIYGTTTMGGKYGY